MNIHSSGSSALSFGAWVLPALAVTLLASGCGLGTPDTVISPTGGADVTQSATPGDGDRTPDITTVPAPTVSAAESPGTTRTSDVLANLVVLPPQAAETALREHPGSAVIDLELDRARGVTVWEVTLVSGEGKRKVDVDAVSGVIVSDETDHTEDLAKYLARVDAAKLDHVAAIDAVLTAQPGGSLVEIGLEEDHGRLAWKADVISSDHRRFEVHVDAVTGAVFKNEWHD